MWNLLWLIPVGSFFLLEWWGIHNSHDTKQPLTYWVRSVFRLKGGWLQKVHSIGWWIAAAIMGWLCFHFLLERA
jgi:hypothetical protein